MSDSLCPDCGVSKGEYHAVGCDVERCAECGGQCMSCGCEESDELLPWDGEWPGLAECREYDFWCYWGAGWVECDKDHPKARGNLNRLAQECTWSKEEKKWVI